MTQQAPASHATSRIACIARSDISVRTTLAAVEWKIALAGWAAAFVVGVLLALLVMALGWWQGGAWERETIRAVAMTTSPLVDILMLTLPVIGTNYALAPVIYIAAFMLVRRGYATAAVHLIVVQLGSWTVNPALKFALMRPRPELIEQRGQHAFPAFPSGHMIAVVAVLGTAAYLLHRCGRGRWVYVVLGAFFVIVAWSRVYLGVHWPTDVAAGTVVGAVWLLASNRAFSRAHARAAGAWHETSTSRPSP